MTAEVELTAQMLFQRFQNEKWVIIIPVPLTLKINRRSGGILEHIHKGASVCSPLFFHRLTCRRPPLYPYHHRLERVQELVGKLGTKAESVCELCCRLYTLCERKKRAAEALAYNSLVQS